MSATWTHRTAHFAEPRSYPVAGLASAMGLDPTSRTLTSELCIRLGLDRSWVRRCRSHGLTARGADHWATLAGLHPDIVWPGWWDDPTDTPLLDGEDDPPLDELEPISDERLAALRSNRWAAA